MKYYCDVEDCPHDCGYKDGVENPKEKIFVCQNTGKLIIMESESEKNAESKC